MTFAELVNYLTQTTNPTITIKARKKIIKGMARFTTINFPDGEYIKVIIADGSFMLLMISDELVYYSNSIIGQIKEIPDSIIGTDEKIKYHGKEYEPVNKNDYQLVLQKYVGGINDIEGECRFTDYQATDGSKSMISLGWLSYNHERADICYDPIDLSEIQPSGSVHEGNPY